MTSNLPDGIINEIVEAAIEAGFVVRGLRSASSLIREKADGSPVTQADLAAERVILSRLARVVPELPVVSEECASDGAAVGAATSAFLLVDPLDGTKEYVKGLTDYTVNIAMIVDGAPVFGVVVAPELGQAYVGDGRTARLLTFGSDGQVLHERIIAARTRGMSIAAVVSGSHLDSRTIAFMDAAHVDHRISVGSSLKFCRLATGEADIYPRLARTMQWDTAAGDAVLRSAGGHTCDMAGQDFCYGRFRNAPDDTHPFANSHFISFGNWSDVDMIHHVKLTQSTSACSSDCRGAQAVRR